MESSNYFSNYGSRRALDEFPDNKIGEPLKTCSRYSKKIKQPTFNTREDFLSEIENWDRLA